MRPQNGMSRELIVFTDYSREPVVNDGHDLCFMAPFALFLLINTFCNPPKRQSQYVFNLLSSVQCMCMTAHTYTNPIWNTRKQALIAHHIKSSAHPMPAEAGSICPVWFHSKHWPVTSQREDSVNYDSRDQAGHICAPVSSCQFWPVKSSSRSLTCCPQVHEVTHRVNDCWLFLLNGTPEAMLLLRVSSKL